MLQFNKRYKNTLHLFIIFMHHNARESELY